MSICESALNTQRLFADQRATPSACDIYYGSEAIRSRYRDVKVYIIHINPDIAQLFLRSNDMNRPLIRGHVGFMKQVLESGDMVMNGEAIIRSSKGVLLNGQHRLTACVESGIGFDAMVVEGIDVEAFRTIDGGRKRSTGDFLAIQGESLSNRLAAAVQQLLTFADLDGSTMYSRGGKSTRKATASVASRVLEAHPRLRESVSAMAATKLFANQQGYVLHYLFSIVSKELADEFASVISSGHSDTERPFVIFREGLINQGTHSHLRHSHSAKAIKAFNAERSGNRPKLLRLNANEDFPLIQGLDYQWLVASLS